MNERDKLIRATVYADIDLERERQDENVGHEFDDTCNPNDWVTFVTRFLSIAADDTLGKVSQKANKLPLTTLALRYRLNMIKAAAVVIAAIEAFDRAQGIVKRHYE